MSAVDVLSETELEVRDALPDDVHAIAASMPGMCFTGVRHLKKFPPPLMKCVNV